MQVEQASTIPASMTEEISMKKSLTITAALLLTSSAAIAAETLIPVPPVPGSVATTVFTINDNNVVAGSYTTADRREHGFFGTLDGSYTTFESSFKNTQARGINNDGMVMGIGYDNKHSSAFERYPDGSIAYVTKGEKPLGFGVAGAINAQGTFVADAFNRRATKHFNFFGANAEYTKKIVTPGLSVSRPRGVNDSMDVAGYYQDDGGNLHGFLLTDGAVSTIDYPGAEGTIVYGINNADEMAGIWGDQNDNPHAFVYDAASGQFKSIVEKGTDNGKYAVSYGLNNEGLVAVNFVAADGPFIYCPRKASQCPSGANAGFKSGTNAKQP
jgi:hypothetical protein